eukprot:Nk52_evm58s2367 gene=Nk52_evmTU58s2367
MTSSVLSGSEIILATRMAFPKISGLAVGGIGKKLGLVRYDITKLQVDAIVNAANSSLLGGGGVDGCIHRAAGPQLKADCRGLGGCRVGEAKITEGCRLPAKHVIHTVGPQLMGDQGGPTVLCSSSTGEWFTRVRKVLIEDVGEDSERGASSNGVRHSSGVIGSEGKGDVDGALLTPAQLLSCCYLNSLRCMKRNGLRTIAFPCISTGVYGYPAKDACQVAMESVMNWLAHRDNEASVDAIVFCVFLESDEVIYRDYLARHISG